MKTRRSFLAGSAAAASLLLDKARGASFSGPLGLETYSLRKQLGVNFESALNQMRVLGFTEVEVASLGKQSAKEWRRALDQAGLQATSTGGTWEEFTKDPQAVVGNAQTLGAKYIMLGWIPHEGKFTAERCGEAVGNFNRWGDVCHKAGLHFTFHVHGYEFEPSPDGTLLDTMAKEMTPGIADFQMDTFWIVWPGQDPVKLLQKYPKRFVLMHLKDLRAGVKGNIGGSAPETDDVPLGSGQVQWADVLKAAHVAGVERYYIEDESPTPLENIPQSVRYLKTMAL